jgi:Rad3-related DNA helicase
VLGALRGVVELLACLTNTDTDGRVFLSSDSGGSSGSGGSGSGSGGGGCSNSSGGSSSIRYVLLNPAPHLSPIVRQARSVLLLGGTLQPFQYFTTMLGLGGGWKCR